MNVWISDTICGKLRYLSFVGWKWIRTVDGGVLGRLRIQGAQHEAQHKEVAEHGWKFGHNTSDNSWFVCVCGLEEDLGETRATTFLTVFSTLLFYLATVAVALRGDKNYLSFRCHRQLPMRPRVWACFALMSWMKQSVPLLRDFCDCSQFDLAPNLVCARACVCVTSRNGGGGKSHQHGKGLWSVSR